MTKEVSACPSMTNVMPKGVNAAMQMSTTSWMREESDMAGLLATVGGFRCAYLSRNDAISDLLRKLIGPFLDRLVGNAHSLGC